MNHDLVTGLDHDLDTVLNYDPVTVLNLSLPDYCAQSLLVNVLNHNWLLC